MQDYFSSNSCTFAFAAEDTTGVIPRVTYNSVSNSFIGFDTPLAHGVPLPDQYRTNSYTELEKWFEEKQKSTFINVHMLQPGFAMAGVPSISKMYRTFATCEIHSVLHFTEKIKVYIVHFDEKNYTLLRGVIRTIQLNISVYIKKNVCLSVCSLCISTPYKQMQLNFAGYTLSSRGRSTTAFRRKKSILRPQKAGICI
jgi:hypothetical protein